MLDSLGAFSASGSELRRKCVMVKATRLTKADEEPIRGSATNGQLQFVAGPTVVLEGLGAMRRFPDHLG